MEGAPSRHHRAHRDEQRLVLEDGRRPPSGRPARLPQPVFLPEHAALPARDEVRLLEGGMGGGRCPTREGAPGTDEGQPGGTGLGQEGAPPAGDGPRARLRHPVRLQSEAHALPPRGAGDHGPEERRELGRPELAHHLQGESVREARGVRPQEAVVPARHHVPQQGVARPLRPPLPRLQARDVEGHQARLRPAGVRPPVPRPHECGRVPQRVGAQVQLRHEGEGGQARREALGQAHGVPSLRHQPRPGPQGEDPIQLLLDRVALVPPRPLAAHGVARAQRPRDVPREAAELGPEEVARGRHRLPLQQQAPRPMGGLRQRPAVGERREVVGHPLFSPLVIRARAAGSPPARAPSRTRG